MLTPTLPRLTLTQALLDEVSTRADEAEREGTLPLDLVEAMREAGIFRMMQPASLGGHEISPAELISIIERLSYADGSAGWVGAIGAGGPGFTAWLDPAVARDVLGQNADISIATVFAATGQLRPRDGGVHELSGRWPFASGCRHASWFFTGGFVFDGDAPRITEQGPDWRLALFPSDQGQIIDNWDVLGMRATGSNDIEARAVRVPDELLIRPFLEPARHDGPVWRLSFFTLAGISLVGVPLGIARRALDELTRLASTKVRAGTFTPLSEDGYVQTELARAEGRLRSARAMVFDVLDDLWQTATRGDAPTVEQRGTFQLATNEALRASVEAVDASFTLAGSSVVRPHPIQRCFRDVHTVAQHAYFSPVAMQRFAKVRFGIEQPTLFM